MGANGLSVRPFVTRLDQSMTTAVISQGNRAMRRVFPMPSDCYLLQLTKVQDSCSTGSLLPTKTRLNVKLKQHHGAHVLK